MRHPVGNRIDDLGDLLLEPAELGRFGEERGGDRRSDPGRGLEAPRGRLELGVRGDERGDLGLEPGDALVEGADQGGDVGPDEGTAAW